MRWSARRRPSTPPGAAGTPCRASELVGGTFEGVADGVPEVPHGSSRVDAARRRHAPFGRNGVAEQIEVDQAIRAVDQVIQAVDHVIQAVEAVASTIIETAHISLQAPIQLLRLTAQDTDIHEDLQVLQDIQRLQRLQKK